MVRVVAYVFLSCFVLSTLTQGVRVSRAANQDPVLQGNELLQLSEEQNKTDHGLALTTAQEALTLLQPTNDKTSIANAYFQIGRCHHALSNFTEATQNYQAALELFRDLNKPDDQAEKLIMLAYV